MIGGISTPNPTPKVISTAAEWDAVAKVYDDTNSARSTLSPVYQGNCQVRLDGNYVNFLVDGANYEAVAFIRVLTLRKRHFANKVDATVTVEGLGHVSRTYSSSIGKTLCNIDPRLRRRHPL